MAYINTMYAGIFSNFLIVSNSLYRQVDRSGTADGRYRTAPHPFDATFLQVSRALPLGATKRVYTSPARYYKKVYDELTSFPQKMC